MSADGHGLPDDSVRSAHDMIHHAEQEEHEHEAAAKRGLPDWAAEAEYDMMHGAEVQQEAGEEQYHGGQN
ncbi:Uu.00g020660.m01.CDS01 [Anthostomella pinea]|uniref:Uu.00g020660.m01.CDS01 n=1 Tax=Anthostomella pinea TaxID=933095 RepID=A0AAI8VZI5_9PEZI|nr:Uu.00g020660.m01.CDS01 [Anthostomella pinea]